MLVFQNTLAVQTVPDLDTIDIKMDENASIETIQVKLIIEL